jgi:pimeloyl-ACP methyl ester carboxylesterase
MKRAFKRWAWKIGRIVVIAYLGLALVLALLQTQLIFPGAASQGTPDAQIDAARLDGELVTLTTPAGEKVVALFGSARDPAGRPHPQAKSRPTLLYFYGNGMCAAAAEIEFQEFRRRGFNVMVPDYLGYGMSGGKPSEAGVYATADACFDHLKQRGDVDPTKIVPLGLSLGGGPALHLASTRTEVPCVVTIAAFTSVDAMARKLFPYLPTGAILKHHFDNEKKIAALAPPRPLFLAHGTRDGIIPFEMSQKLADAASAGGSKVVKYDVIGGDHNDIYDIGSTGLIDAITQFVNEHADR